MLMPILNIRYECKTKKKVAAFINYYELIEDLV